MQLFLHNYYSCQGLQMKVVLKVGIIPWDGSLLYRVCSSFQDDGSSMSSTSRQGHTTGFHCYGQGSLRSQESVCVCCILCGSWRMTSSRQDSFSLMFSAWAVFFQPRHTWPTISWDISPLHGVVISFWHLPQVISLRKGLLSAQLLVSPSHSEAGCYCHTSKRPRAYIISETLPLDWFG